MSLPYLFAHQNPHAPKRADGRRYWGYPTRAGGVRPRVIGVHTTESVFDQAGTDTGAEAVARYQASVERPSSYHRIVDRDSTVVQLPDEAVAFGIAGLNTIALHVSMAMRAADWSDPDKAARALPTLKRAATVVGTWCRTHHIPVRRLTRKQALDGQAGIIAHGDADPGRRSDPGADFPWAVFLELVRTAAATRPTGPAYTSAGHGATVTDRIPAPTVQEDDMALQTLVVEQNGPLWLVTHSARTKQQLPATDLNLLPPAQAKVINEHKVPKAALAKFKVVKP